MSCTSPTLIFAQAALLPRPHPQLAVPAHDWLRLCMHVAPAPTQPPAGGQLDTLCGFHSAHVSSPPTHTGSCLVPTPTPTPTAASTTMPMAGSSPPFTCPYALWPARPSPHKPHACIFRYACILMYMYHIHAPLMPCGPQDHHHPMGPGGPVCLPRCRVPVLGRPDQA